MPFHLPILGIVGIGIVAIATIHALLTLIATVAWRTRRGTFDPSLPLPPISVLKPLCGAEVGLYENLQSFFRLRHDCYQIVFGVCDASDPALQIVERLREEFPAVDVTVVVSDRQYGGNRKVSNLINMLAHASNDVLIISDSDVRVGADYLRAFTEPLRNLRVGLVTCIYRDIPTKSVWSRLGAIYINDWYIPSVLLAWMFGHRSFVSGQTICINKDTLRDIGGLASLANHLADDYVLGQLVRKSGKSVVLSDYVPRIVRHEPDYDALLEHEVRWMRTIMVLKPFAFRMLFLSFGLPLAIIGVILAAPYQFLLAASLFGCTVALRVLQHYLGPRAADAAPEWTPGLILARDFLLLYSWYKSLAASQFSWRGAKFRVSADGFMIASSER